MPKENAPELFGLFHYLHQLSCEAKRGMKASLKECPRCHFMMLEGVLANIEQHGKDGSIYVSDLAAAIRQPMPAVSRALRQLEQDGLIERITDPNDRRKTDVGAGPDHRPCRGGKAVPDPRAVGYPVNRSLSHKNKKRRRTGEDNARLCAAF